ncbi:hypothetical protein MW887_004185 [Aspergillus wentii]|nr:hypothetical protein MW887_004185 [Aspergillus wentii]
MAEYKLNYESELDSFQLYYRYEDKQPHHDWRTAALRGPALPALGNAVAGAVGAAISNVTTYPLSLIVARLQTQRQRGRSKTDSGEDEDEDEEEEYTSVLDAARKIYAQEGLGSLYNGLVQDTAKTVADSFLFFLAYESFRQRRITARFGASRKGRRNVVLPVWDELMVGVLAGAVSKLFTTPLANIVTRKQTQGGEKNVSTRDIAAQIKAEKGLRGFWSGYSATLILTLNPSITFFLNEMLKYALLPRTKRGRPSPVTTFLLAALSKAAASSVTYPISMAKTRAQAMSSTQTNSPKSSPASSTVSSFTPQILSAVFTIAKTEGLAALYAGLPGEVLKGFFSHGFTMLAKDAVYSIIVKAYYLLLIALRKYPTPEELIERAREQAEEYAEAAREGAKDLVEKTKAGTEEALENHAGNVAADGTSNTMPGNTASGNVNDGVESSSGFRVPHDPALDVETNETAELVGDYVEDEADEWRSLYHWFWEGRHKD